jgi:hypothetical protein
VGKNDGGAWICKSTRLLKDIDLDTGQEIEVNDPREYKLTGLLEDQESVNEYILLGRTYMDRRNYKAVEG